MTGLKENKFVEAQEPSSAKQGSHTADPIVPSLALEDIALERVHSRATSVDQPSHEKLNAIPLPSPASTHDSIHPLELEIYGESVPRETLDNMESRAWTLQHDLPMSVSQPLFHAGMPAAGDLSPWHKSGYNHRLDIPQDPVNETLTWRKPSSTQAALHTTLAEQDPFLSDASRIDGYHHEIADLPQTGHLQATSFSSHTLEVSHSLTSSVFIRSQERDTAGASLERRLEQVLSASETAGFETVDEMMATYYTADLTEDSASGWAQSRSRKRSLYTFLAKLHENVSAWSSADAQGYYRHMTEATEMLCVNEFLHARKALGDSQISGAQSPDIAQEPALSSSQGQTPSGKTVIRVQVRCSESAILATRDTNLCYSRCQNYGHCSRS